MLMRGFDGIFIQLFGLRKENVMEFILTVFLSIGLSLIVTLIGAILHLRQVDKMLNTYMENLNKVHERFLKNVNQRYGQK